MSKGSGSSAQTLVSTTQRVDTEIISDDWTTLVDDVKLDDDPTFYESAALDVSGYGNLRVTLVIQSTGAPGHVQVTPQFSTDDGVSWAQLTPGYWAAMFWEDTDTADQIRWSGTLPVAGVSSVRMRLVATGTDADNFFECSVMVRPYRGPSNA